MTDVEGQPRGPPNPYRAQPVTPLSKYHPLNILQRLAYMGATGWVLIEHYNAYEVLMRSPEIRHVWFKVGLATTIALLGVKAYLEIFEGQLKKATVNYKNYPQTTHLSIFLWLAASVAFHVALWPHYGWNAFLVLFALFFGWVLQPMLLLPPWLQNVSSFVILTFFLQEYQ